MPQAKKPHILLILDGWGHSETSQSNAIKAANTPFWDTLWSEYPHTLISTSGKEVGLPEGQMGNSEVGHMNLGAGRVVYQDFTRITKSIEDGDFFQNPILKTASSTDKAVHIIGLLSPGGVHSHTDHINAMVELAEQNGAPKVYVHAFLDGRDTAPKSAESSLAETDGLLKQKGIGRVASIIGRYYAMDRDQRWDRVEKAYRLLTEAVAEHTATDCIAGLKAAYDRGETDEFISPTLIPDIDGQVATIESGDTVIFMNFRADRAREITRAFVEPHFSGFKRRKTPALKDFVMLTQYADDIHTSCAYTPSQLTNVFGEHMANLGKTQLRIAETEKYAHVTFFFSGGREALFEGEDRILVQSPEVATYDLQPEMSAPEPTLKLVKAIKSGQYDTIICNYANGDMVGHTGKFDAAVKAVEAVDKCLSQVVAAVEAVGGECLITADHGNAEQMTNPTTGQPHTAHTCEPVPLIYVGTKRQGTSLSSGGALSDIIPSLLDLMGIEQPEEMTGHSLITSTL
ncbi:MAG: 2,3-bisphosphoglycerate-independent phosphoglycerate mutase [Pseudomonadales bacterium]|nr:2,3-bisphosphoglycerate-independent phosphoglycerate mutase [Pseudomonadales bacterium]